ncbi:hypothetical protein Tco_0070419, partial [Tanacetum coccineum]
TFDALSHHSEILSDSNNDGTSSDDDSYENIKYIEASSLNLEIVSLEEVNEDKKEKEFDLEDIFQIQDVILHEKLLNISRLVTNIESLKDNPTPDRVLKSPSSFPIPIMDKETRSGSTTTHANNYLPEYESFHFDNPSFPRPPLKPPDVEICLNFKPDSAEINNFDVLNNDELFDPGEGENAVFLNDEEDDSFILTIRTFLPFVTYPEASPPSCSTGSEDSIFDPGIIP